MSGTTIFRLVIVAAVAVTLVCSARADVPARSASGVTLDVPADLLDRGDVYHVTPGEDTQLICLSDAPLQRIAATCNRVVGYFVVPFDVPADQPPLLTGVLRIPVAVLRTGSPDFDELLRSGPALDVAQHSEITWELKSATDVKRISNEKGRQKFTLTLAGELTVKGQGTSLEAPATVELIPFTWQTMRRNVGDLLILRTRFDLKLADLGVNKPSPAVQDRVADVVSIDAFLLCNTMPPDKVLDPNIPREQSVRQQRFLVHVRDLGDPAKGYELGRALMRDTWDDAAALHRLASATLTESGIEPRDLLFVIKAAHRANELTQFKDPVLLGTLARAHFERFDLADAVKWQQRAAETFADAKSPAADELRATLEKYEAAAKSSAH